jgi:integrase
LSSKHQKLETGEITNRSFGDYYRVCQRIITVFGKMRLVSELNVDDFDRLRSEISRTWGPVGLGNEINRIRMVFKYGQDAGLLTHRVNFGPNFKRPSRRVLRKCRAANGPRMFEANQIRTILAANYEDRQSGFRERPDFRAMILLGINCGFGNADVGLLRRQSVDLVKGWVNFPRPKTGVPRRCSLWPATVVAMKQALEFRVMPIDSEDEELVFLTRQGRCWHNDSPSSPLSAEFRKLVQSVDRQAECSVMDEGGAPPAPIYRRGLGFYALRHTFETIAGETRDQVAVDHIMGHERDDMATVYRERIGDERLIAVTQHVHDWLFRSALPVESQTKNG